ncbi:MAG: AI-2E family transporter [Bdellovibrionota bacterium]|nr:AI-2E family transporter [Bdellovibrionota bacterium]
MYNSRTLIRRERYIKSFTVFALLCFFAWTIFAVENMMASVVLALVITYLLNPFVNKLERKGTRRTTSILLLFVVVSLGLSLLVSLFYPILSTQIGDLQAELPKYQIGIVKLISNLEKKAQEIMGGYYSFDIIKGINTLIAESAGALFSNIPDFASKFLTVFILAPFFAFFMLRDGRGVVRQFLRMMPNNLFELALNLNYQINEQMGDFIRARLLEAGIVGFVIWVGLAIIGFPYASILAIFAALTNLIPYVGPFIGAVPAIAIALINKDPSIIIFLVCMTYAIAQIIDIVFIIPMVVAKIVNLHPVFVVVVIIIGSQLMGILGMIISIPVASALKLTFTALYDHLINFRS